MKINNLSRSQKGFTAVEGLLIVLILAVIGFGGYYVYHSNHQANRLNAISSADKKAPSTKSGKSNNSQYLNIKQLGIKIPLTSNISDLSYTWDTQTGAAAIGSTVLMNDFIKEDPTDCSQYSGTALPIALIVSQTEVNNSPDYWQVPDAPRPNKTITVDGLQYYWYEPNAGTGCDFHPSASLENTYNNYYYYALNAFGAAVSDK